MIQAAMLFALGAIASALVCLAFFTVLARRIRRVTEQRLKASLATKRADFDAERDEIRARNAIEINRLERETGALRDRVTAHRLDADLKTQEIAAFRADLAAREEEVTELGGRIEELQAALVEAKRRLAETGTALRAGHHALETEMQRRLALQDEISKLRQTAEDRRVELVGRQAEIEYLRSLVSENAAEAGEAQALAEGAEAVREADANADDTARKAATATRSKPPATEAPRQVTGDGGNEQPGMREIARIADDIRRMANDKELAAFVGEEGRPDKDEAGKAGRKSAPRTNGKQAQARQAEGRPGGLGAAEARFFKALNEIRSLKDETKTPAE
ncbi:hypothetical protein [Afifella pfennigii]|uniref:hypothetical protein n=1 Tax=Afifella pfennigii TaxID=209897 RepID=UPI0012EBB1C1|nr:hypothetical protein [Afifella pfennigii]